MNRERLIRDLEDLEARRETHRIAVRQNDDRLFRQVLYHQMLDRGPSLFWGGHSREWWDLDFYSEDVRYHYPERYTVSVGPIQVASLSWSPEKALQWWREVFSLEAPRLLKLDIPFRDEFRASLKTYREVVKGPFPSTTSRVNALLLEARFLNNASNEVHSLVTKSLVEGLRRRVGLSVRYLLQTRVLDKIRKLDGLEGSQGSLVPTLRDMAISIFVDREADAARASLAKILCDL